MDNQDLKNSTLTDNPTDDSANSVIPKTDDKASGYLCTECGQTSLIEGNCPNCGHAMIPDHEEIPGEKEVDDSDAHDGMPEETKPEDQADAPVEEPETYSLEDIKDAEAEEADITDDE